MLRFSLYQLDRIKLSTLFGYNCVLQSVFSAPTEKLAIVVELPGKKTQNYTYGQLQKDVLHMANIITRRREALVRQQGKESLSWVQRPRPAHVRSVFAEGNNGEFSCDVMNDDGTYNMAIVGETGYSFVVSLLAAWSLNQMAVPMSATQKYATELSYILEHSKSRAVLGETRPLKESFQKEYDLLRVETLSDLSKATTHSTSYSLSSSPSSASPSTFSVETIFDAQRLIHEINEQSELFDENAKMLTPKHLPAEEEREQMQSAQDIMNRVASEKAAAEERYEAQRQQTLREQFRENCNVFEDVDDGTVPYYDTEHLDSLNAVHRSWVEGSLLRPSKNDDCLMIYTSGTTARPKGAVHTHASVHNMVRVLQSAWEWSREDVILHMLPMHHIHGLVNVLLCSLASNARCVLTKFDDPLRIAHRLEKGDISLLMGVPTMYKKMILAVKQKMSSIEKVGFKNVVSQSVRLCVSGSAALPVPVINEFYEISGHIFLERYGMTEIGMALSQKLRPAHKRIPGTVGVPLPTVRAIVCQHPVASNDEGLKKEEGATDEYDEIGQLAIASESMFDRYWGNPVATKKELIVTSQGHRYFNTGDTVGVRRSCDGSDAPVFTILGRTSVDIIKCCGYKLSALEIEAALLSCKDLFLDVAVVGCRDEIKGEKVVAVVVLQAAALLQWDIPNNFDIFESPALNKEFNGVVREMLAHYKCPERFIILPEIPRNPTGKVNKKSLLAKLSL